MEDQYDHILFADSSGVKDRTFGCRGTLAGYFRSTPPECHPPLTARTATRIITTGHETSTSL